MSAGAAEGPTPGAGAALFTRSRTDRVVWGVAGGLGERFGIDPILLRVAFVVLSTAGGAGIIAYVVGWVVSREPEAGASRVPPTVVTLQQATAVGMILVGVLLVLRELGLWFADGLTWPITLAAAGSAVIWARGDEQDRAQWSALAGRIPRNRPASLSAGRVSPVRLAAGALLVATGMAAFLAANQALSFAALGQTLLAMLVTAAGVGLLLGPWVWRLGRQLADERRERIRSEERTDLAAHLHDSVLQTLALIQRSEDPAQMSQLARLQERELRTWLYGTHRDPARLGAAIEALAARVEERYRVAVDVVVVGDALLDDPLRALVHACGEALHNAAQHSGAATISMYAEVEPDMVNAFVTDQGRGFVTGEIPADRHGITHSIRGRMERHGGSATITSHPGEGTEVQLRLARERVP